MTDFWSFYIIALSSVVIGGCVFLLLWTRKLPVEADENNHLLHSFDGIVELNNPMPRWWLWLFWATIAFALVYLTLYPGMGKWQGVLGWTSAKQHAAETETAQKHYAPIFARYVATPIAELSQDAEALKVGERIFLNNCAACHGSDAGGGPGFPNLRDDDWLHGGTPEAIEATVLEGRQGSMPAWKDILGENGVKNVTAHVLSLSGRKVNSKQAAEGASVFQANCAGCHGAEGTGNPAMGAPNLSDKTWLYGGSTQKVIETISHGRNGQMPAWKEILGPEKAHVVVAYVYSLSHGTGHGE